MDTRIFLERSLGDTGTYCLFVAKEGGTRKQLFFDDIATLEATAKRYDIEGFDTYFALATFTEHTRSQDTVAQLRSLFLDLDCGEGKPFADQTEAVHALRNFCTRMGLPRPVLVSSGYGVHVYWTLTEPVTRAEWQPVAARLKELCAAHNFEADPAVTSDAARILRIPGTHNHKRGTTALVAFLTGSEPPPPVDLETFSGLLGGSKFTPAPAALHHPGLSAVGQQLLGNKDSVFKTIAQMSLRGEGCAQIAHILTHQADIDEPLWRAGLSIAAHCSDGDEAIHKMSDGHPDYDPRVTETKARSTKGPYRCERFDEYRPGVCEDCAFRGKIGSPISLGRELKIADPVDEETEAVVVDSEPNAPGSAEQEYRIPKFPSPYVRGAVGGVYKVTTDDEGDPEEVLIYHHDLYAVRRVRDVDFGDAVVMRLHLPRDGVREFTIPQSQISAPQELRKVLSMWGVTATTQKAWDRIGEYIMGWVNELQARASATAASRQFGWANDMQSFVLGSREYTKDGVGFNPATPATSGFFPAFEPRGTLAEWTDLMDMYATPGMELYQLVVAFGFGAPLMALSAQNGFILHLNGDSGFGKSTAQFAAMSIWGSPRDLQLKLDDTTNAKMNRLEVFKNVFCMFDEMTNTSPEDFSKIAYMVSLGQQKVRMSSGSNQERTLGDEWATLVVSSGNVSWHAKMEAIKADPSAEKERVFEVNLVSYIQKPKAMGDTFLKAITSTNYGVAGDVFIRYVVSNLDDVRTLFHSVQQKLDTAANMTNKTRFKSSGFAAALTGLMIAEQLGLVRYSSREVFKYVVRLLLEEADEARRSRRTHEDYLNDYIAEHWNDILRIKSTQDLRGKNDNGIEQLIVPEATPRGQLVARYETDVHRLYLLPKPLRTWCTKQQINSLALIDGLAQKYKVERVKMRLGKGTHLKLPPADLIAIDWEVKVGE